MRIAICEDDKFLLEIITEHVNKIILDNNMDAEVVFATDNYEKMDLFINGDGADLYVFDVGLGSKDSGNNGIKLAETIVNKNDDKFILFVTGSNPNINKIFEVGAYNCLTKPLNLAYFEIILIQIYDKFSKKRDIIEKVIEIKSIDNKLNIIKCANITHVEKLDNNCVVCLISGNNIKTCITLKDMEVIADNKLIRTHKSFLCNRSYIDRIDYRKGEIIMETGYIVLLGGKYKNEFKKYYG